MFGAIGRTWRHQQHLRPLPLLLLQPGSCTAAAATAAPAAPAASAQFSSSSSAGADTPPGAAFLASLVDYEKLGVPKSAGVGSSSSSNSSSSPGFDLRGMRSLLSGLGDPQRQLKAVHVAGTKGKGSVVMLLGAMLRASGYRVGCYTSPHLFDIRERVTVGGSSSSSSPLAPAEAAAAAAAAQPVSEADWEKLALQVQAAMQQQQQQAGSSDGASSSSDGTSASGMPSHFEAVTAMALKHFADEAVDIAVIETGLGGATDATNVFDSQSLQAAVITAIGFDHLDALGGSLTSIAAAKAGIMKPGVPVVVAPQQQAPCHTAAAADAAAGAASGGQQQSVADVVWGVLRRVAGTPGVQCPLLAAGDVVQVSSSSDSSSGSSDGITILPGPGFNLARQTLDISGRLGPDSSLPTPAQHTAAASTTAAAAAAVDGEGGEAVSVDLPGVALQLVGPHQAGNVAAAVTAALLLGQRGWRGVTPVAMRAGLEAAWLPGRFQVLQLPGASHHVVLDGAHTADSAAALAATVRAAFPQQQVLLLVAMAADKQHREVLEALRGLRPRVVIFTTVPIAGSHARAAPPGTLAAHWQAAAMLASSSAAAVPRFRCRELIQANLGAALDKARHELGAFPGGRGVVVVAGSLHGAAAAARQLEGQLGR